VLSVVDGCRCRGGSRSKNRTRSRPATALRWSIPSTARSESQSATCVHSFQRTVASRVYIFRRTPYTVASRVCIFRRTPHTVASRVCILGTPHTGTFRVLLCTCLRTAPRPENGCLAQRATHSTFSQGSLAQLSRKAHPLYFLARLATAAALHV
jgi:hypothetical protein